MRQGSRWQTPNFATTWGWPPRQSCAKRARVVQELPDWELLREAVRAIKYRTLRHLDSYLLQLESVVRRAGGTVHWARDAAEANQIIAGIATAQGAREVVKIKSLTSDEIGLNEALSKVGVEAIETDLAELIIQLAGERSSHILVPAIHKNRAEIRAVPPPDQGHRGAHR